MMQQESQDRMALKAMQLNRIRITKITIVRFLHQTLS